MSPRGQILMSLDSPDMAVRGPVNCRRQLPGSRNKMSSIPNLIQDFTESFASLEADLDRALKWLGFLGVRHQNTRLDRYLEKLRRFNCSTEDQQHEIQLASPAALFNASTEAHDLVAVHRALGGTHDDAIRERLGRIASGPEYPHQEVALTSSNAARNFAFELRIAARIASNGVEVSFAPVADLICSLRQVQIYIQCKRSQSLDSLPALCKKGVKQLQGGYSLSTFNTRGVVAVDVSKAVNPAAQMFFCDDHSHVERILMFQHEQVESVVRASGKFRPDWTTLGAVSLNRQIFYVRQKSSYFPEFDELVSVEPSRSAMSEDVQILQQVGTLLSPSPLLT